MDFLSCEVLAGGLVPVLFGWSEEGFRTAKRMFRDYRVASHIFCRRIPLPRRLSLCMKFHPISPTADRRLMLEALLDFAKQLDQADVILYLIPCTEEYAGLVWDRQEELEPYYVIADRREMERVWFGASESEEGEEANV